MVKKITTPNPKRINVNVICMLSMRGGRKSNHARPILKFIEDPKAWLDVLCCKLLRWTWCRARPSSATHLMELRKAIAKARKKMA